MLIRSALILSPIFFFNDTAPTEIYTLSLHDALPIYHQLTCIYNAHIHTRPDRVVQEYRVHGFTHMIVATKRERRSEEHTSELQSRQYLVCRLLLEKKHTIHILIAGTQILRTIMLITV